MEVLARRWWLAYSLRSVKDLRRTFREKNVGSMLIENVDVVEDTGEKEEGIRVIRVLLYYPTGRVDRELMDVCLTEIGIGLIDPIEQQVRQAA